MSYQQHVFSIIAKLGGSKDKAVVDPTLCRFMGDLEGGVFLAQLLYWSDKGSSDSFYKSYREWEEEIFLSKYQVNRSAKHCIEMGFLETKVRKANGSPTVHYAINAEKFVACLVQFVEMESQKFDNPKSNFRKTESSKFDDPELNFELSLTETTTEITTETTQIGDVGLTPTPHADAWEDFLLALCWTCHGHKELGRLTESQGGALTAEAKKIYQDGYTMADLRRWMETHWFKDFRWKKDRQRPRPDTVRSSIPVLRNGQSTWDAYSRPAADHDNSNGYHVDLPLNTSTPSLPTPAPAPNISDPWATCLGEIKSALTAETIDWLQDSQLVAAGTIADANGNQVPLYQVVVTRGETVTWLTRQIAVQLRQRLTTILHHPVQIEIIAAEEQVHEQRSF